MAACVEYNKKLILYADAIFYAHRDPDFIAPKLDSVLEKCLS